MTVQSAASRNEYTASGSPTYPFTFLVLASTDLAVYDNGLLQPTSAYTVTGVGVASGGTVTFNVAPIAGHPIIILSATTYTQNLDLVEGAGFYADSLERALDRNAILTKQLKEITDRTPQFDPFSCTSGIRIDQPVPGFFLLWDSTGMRVASGQSVMPGSTLTIPVFTGGAIVFAAGGASLSQDSANLFWDDANNRLGLGTSTPVVALDSRLNGAGTVLLTNGQTNLVDALFHATPAPRSDGQQSIALAVCTTGIQTGSVSTGRIALFAGAETAGGVSGGAPIWGGNIIVQQNAADTKAQVIGLELSFNNNKGNDALNPADCNHYGVTIDSYGGFSIGPAALAIRKAAVGSTWQRAIMIPSGSITTSGYAFDYQGDGASGSVLIRDDSVIEADRYIVNKALSGTPGVNSIYTQSLAKAWAVFSGASGNQLTPLASYNLKSPGLFRTAAGTYNVTWDRAFTTANYVLVGSASAAGGALTFMVGVGGLTATCAVFELVTDTGAHADSALITFVAYGAQ